MFIVKKYVDSAFADIYGFLNPEHALPVNARVSVSAALLGAAAWRFWETWRWRKATRL